MTTWRGSRRTNQAARTRWKASILPCASGLRGLTQMRWAPRSARPARKASEAKIEARSAYRRSGRPQRSAARRKTRTAAHRSGVRATREASVARDASSRTVRTWKVSLARERSRTVMGPLASRCQMSCGARATKRRVGREQRDEQGERDLGILDEDLARPADHVLRQACAPLSVVLATPRVEAREPTFAVELEPAIERGARDAARLARRPSRRDGGDAADDLATDVVRHRPEGFDDLVVPPLGDGPWIELASRWSAVAHGFRREAEPRPQAPPGNTTCRHERHGRAGSPRGTGRRRGPRPRRPRPRTRRTLPAGRPRPGAPRSPTCAGRSRTAGLRGRGDPAEAPRRPWPNGGAATCPAHPVMHGGRDAGRAARGPAVGHRGQGSSFSSSAWRLPNSGRRTSPSRDQQPPRRPRREPPRRRSPSPAARPRAGPALDASSPGSAPGRCPA